MSKGKGDGGYSTIETGHIRDIAMKRGTLVAFLEAMKLDLFGESGKEAGEKKAEEVVEITETLKFVKIVHSGSVDFDEVGYSYKGGVIGVLKSPEEIEAEKKSPEDDEFFGLFIRDIVNAKNYLSCDEDEVSENFSKVSATNDWKERVRKIDKLANNKEKACVIR